MHLKPADQEAKVVFTFSNVRGKILHKYPFNSSLIEGSIFLRSRTWGSPQMSMQLAPFSTQASTTGSPKNLYYRRKDHHT